MHSKCKPAYSTKSIAIKQEVHSKVITNKPIYVGTITPSSERISLISYPYSSPAGIFRAKNNDNKQSKVTLVTTILACIQ